MWYNDEKVQRLLDQLLDELCTCERNGGESYESVLVFISSNPGYPVLFASDGKPWYPPEHQTDLDVEMGVKFALKKRVQKEVKNG